MNKSTIGIEKLQCARKVGMATLVVFAHIQGGFGVGQLKWTNGNFLPNPSYSIFPLFHPTNECGCFECPHSTIPTILCYSI